jgi:cytochrome c-type biogenesis protein
MSVLVALFATISSWLESSAWVAIGAAFIWGIVSVLLSPCHISSIPLAIGYVTGQGSVQTRSAFGLSLVFSMGILLTIAAVGGITAAFGRMLGDVGALKYVVAAVFAVVGLWLMGIIRLPNVGIAGGRFRARGPIGALLLGLLFGVALGPCSFGFMAPLLGVAFRNAASRPAVAAGLIGAYATGHVGVIVLAGTFAGFVQRLLNWDERSSGTRIIRFVCGVLVILAGVVMVLT